ncbi:type I glyceraldehyde-3-phosphate dehydrogenase [Paramaledivibacter caminithermalis]|jgi:glyceraldehyde 3-phosphate dehydrogenase|uniref:Glyceraldehyde-3-phosphate dehydrogenase n=1 Tax=Paramaledivibacter caminithermalis (strain DSM 15212 / CIP 107654 / DViRD3) TaxID=1121301 RepID=A0A1M6M0P8_PARC5|nr:type I glyceraldehyde-3-phosphate dehydrogenase [Paramaledivibacter caminithermalis]SHJ76956.1 glyceraldehyde-3-phosphate dehydrogenase (NAD+) [Paramaledivibacter caminithermalis DSM 15212]
MTIKVGINGFGRIGKNVVKAWLESNKEIEIVGINSGSGPEKHAHIFKYDSLYGIFKEKVETKENAIIIGDKEIRFTSFRDPVQIPWKEMGVDIVIESTGVFRDREKASKHIEAGAKKVIISAPGVNEDKTIVMGVNEKEYDNENHHIISNASCTTNCLAPVIKVLNDEFGIDNGLITTVHAYTADQRILDLPHKDPRRARAAAQSIIPTTTGAAKAIAKVIPDMGGKLNGMAMRVPTPVVSVVDLVANLNMTATVEEVNLKLKEASKAHLKGILEYCEEPLVSVDFKKNPSSSIIDALSTMNVGEKTIKVISWYDNEWGYSNRIIDLADYIAKFM